MMAVFAVMLYRVMIVIAVYPLIDSMSYSNVKLLISMSAATLNLTAIVILNKIYGYVAIWLTNLERPRTQTDFEDSYIFKMFLFQVRKATTQVKEEIGESKADKLSIVSKIGSKVSFRVDRMLKPK